MGDPNGFCCPLSAFAGLDNAHAIPCMPHMIRDRRDDDRYNPCKEDIRSLVITLALSIVLAGDTLGVQQDECPEQIHDRDGE